MDKTISECRLCLTRSSTFLNMFIEKIDNKTIATILTQHFWFEVQEGDICLDCWMKVKDFHIFYSKVYKTHFELTKLEHIKVELSEIAFDRDKVELENLVDEIDVKSELYITHYEAQNPLRVRANNHNKKSVGNDSTNYHSDSDSSISNGELFPPPLKRQQARIRKNKTAIKPIDPIEQANIDLQNKKISEYFSMTCEFCSLAVDSFRNLQSHYWMEHKIKGYVRCCNRKYAHRGLLLEHLEHHLNPETFACEICSKLFKTKRSLQAHLLQHMPTDKRPYKCSECSKTFVLANLLKRHLLTHITERKFVCSECGKTFALECQLKGHQKHMHSEANRHICDVCAKPFRSKYFFEKHHKFAHAKDPPPKVQCNICSSWVKDKHYLKQHIGRHASSDKSFPCSKCPKSATTNRALQRHMRLVHPAKLFECHLCKKSVKSAQSFKEHMASHTGDILYPCPHCSNTYNSSSHRYTHIKKMHVKEWKEQKLKKLYGSATT